MADFTDSTGKRSTEILEGGAIPALDQVPIADNVYIPVGTMVGIDSSGNATPVSANWIGGARGVARDSYDNTGTGHAAAAFKITIVRGVASLDNSATTDALTAADKGRRCYVVDNHTVARTDNSGQRSIAGIFEGLDDDGVAAMVRVGSMEFEDVPTLDLELIAAADLSSHQYQFVKVDSAGKCALAVAGDDAIGVLQNAPASGAVGIVRIFGPTQVIASGTIAIGAQIASDASAKAKLAVQATTDTTAGSDSATAPLVGSNVMGIALTAGSGSGSTAMTIFLNPQGAVPKTLA